MHLFVDDYSTGQFRWDDLECVAQISSVQHALLYKGNWAGADQTVCAVLRIHMLQLHYRSILTDALNRSISSLLNF
jgi:hypothetical protein